MPTEHSRTGAPKRFGGIRVRREHLIVAITTPAIAVAILLAWKLYVDVSNVSRLLLPSPDAVLRATGRMLMEGYVHAHIRVTLSETLWGFAFGAATAIPLGVWLGKSRLADAIASPFIIASQVIPKVAVIPLLILWFGFGETSKIVIAATLAFFPILQNTILGVRSIEPGHKDLMHALGVPWWRRALSLDLPSALPYVLTGFELAIVFAITGAVVGEYLGGDKGLGTLTVILLNSMQTDMLFGAVLILTMLGFSLYAAVAALRGFLIPWHESARPTGL